MVYYEVRWKTSAIKDLRKIDRQHIPRIIEAVEVLTGNPFPPGHRKLYGSERSYRIRVGDYGINISCGCPHGGYNYISCSSSEKGLSV